MALLSGFQPVWNRPDQWTGPGEAWCPWMLFPAQEEKLLGAQGGVGVSGDVAPRICFAVSEDISGCPYLRGGATTIAGRGLRCLKTQHVGCGLGWLRRAGHTEVPFLCCGHILVAQSSLLDSLQAAQRCLSMPSPAWGSLSPSWLPQPLFSPGLRDTWRS